MKIVMLKVGSFSGINKRLKKALEEEHEIIEIDAKEALDPKKNPINAVLNISFVISKYGSDWRRFYIPNSFAFTKMTQYCEKKLRQIKDFDLVLQTQSLFGAASRKLTKPYFIYEDYPPKISDERSQLHEWKKTKSEKKKWDALERRTYLISDKIFTYNDYMKKYIHEWEISKDKLFVAGVGVHFEELPNIKKDYNNKTIIFITSELNFTRHGGRIILEEFRKLEDAKLIIIGKKLEDDPENVESFSFLPFEKLIKFYEQATILLNPGTEGGVQVTLEAMSKKVIPIISDENFLLDGIVKNKKTGIVLKSKKELAKEIKNLFADTKNLKKMGEEAYNDVKKNYTWPVVAKKILKEFTK